MKKALITGITGQDGSYLTEFLLKKKYQVHGIIRRSSSFNTGRINHIINDEKYKDRFFFHYGDVTDASNLNRLLEKINPDEIYNLAAQSHVHVSFQIPDYTAQVDALGTLRFLDAIRETNIKNKILSSINFRIVWKSSRNTSKRNYPVLSAFAICGRKIIRLLDYSELQKHIICLHVMEYCLIMNRQEGVKRLLLEKFL